MQVSAAVRSVASSLDVCRGMSTNWYPHAISFGGGGARIVGSMGVLSHLLDAGLTEHVTDWYGCSAGTYCALFGAIGVSGSWIRDAANIFDGRIVSVIHEENVCDYAKLWGLSSTKSLDEMFGKLIDTWEPGSSAWTFADLAKHRPNSKLHMLATNVTQGRTVVFNAVNTPDIRLLDALCASSALPFYFVPWQHPDTGDFYADGGIINNYIWNTIPNKNETLVVVCSETDIVGRSFKAKQMHNILDYISRIISMIHQHDAPIPKYWIAVNNKNIQMIDFGITKEEKQAGFEEGVRSAKGWLAFRASMPDSSGGTTGNHSCYDHPNKESAVRPLQEQMSDNRILCNSPPLSDPPLDLHKQRRHCVRRWSL